MASITYVDICELINEGKKINQYTSNLPVTYFASMMDRIVKNNAFKALILYYMELKHIKNDNRHSCFGADKLASSMCRRNVYHKFNTIFIHQKA